jgi:hypothetical protein
MIFGQHIYCEILDNIKNYAKIHSYHVTFGAP